MKRNSVSHSILLTCEYCKTEHRVSPDSEVYRFPRKTFFNAVCPHCRAATGYEKDIISKEFWEQIPVCRYTCT